MTATSTQTAPLSTDEVLEYKEVLAKMIHESRVQLPTDRNMLGDPMEISAVESRLVDEVKEFYRAIPFANRVEVLAGAIGRAFNMRR